MKRSYLFRGFGGSSNSTEKTSLMETTPGILAFDDMGMGYMGEDRRSLHTRVEPSRPPGLSNTQWYEFAGNIVKLANGNPVPRVIPKEETREQELARQARFRETTICGMHYFCIPSRACIKCGITQELTQ